MYCRDTYSCHNRCGCSTKSILTDLYGVLGKPQLQPIRFRYLRWNAPRACESDKYFDFLDPSNTNTPLNLRFNLLLGCVLKVLLRVNNAKCRAIARLRLDTLARIPRCYSPWIRSSTNFFLEKVTGHLPSHFATILTHPSARGSIQSCPFF